MAVGDNRHGLHAEPSERAGDGRYGLRSVVFFELVVGNGSRRRERAWVVQEGDSHRRMGWVRGR